MLVTDAALWPASEVLLDDAFLERAFEAPGAEGRTATALVALGEGLPRILVRRLVHGGALGPLLGRTFLGMGRSLRELDVTRRLRASGAPVPRPVLALGRRTLGPLFRCAVGTGYEEGTHDALAFLRGGPDRDALLRAVDAAGTAIRRLHDAGGRHADLHVKNLLLRDRPGGVSCIVIDLDKARITPDLTPDERMTQLMRLYRSLVKRGLLDTVGPRGLARFYATYCGDDRRLRRAMWRRVPLELRRVAVHRLRYREPAA